jgi:8-oxo-dGTP diphosphatase
MNNPSLKQPLRTDGDRHPHPSVTADVITFTQGADGGLYVLLIQRGLEPFAGRWALPGGFCVPGESVEESAARELEEETGLKGLYLEQLRTFSTPGRDPRGWVISVAHMALVPLHRRPEPVAGDDAASARWWKIVTLPDASFKLQHGHECSGPLAFDHEAMLGFALEKLRERVEQLAFELLPPTFTLAQAQTLFETILGDKLPGPTFREWLMSEGLAFEESPDEEASPDSRFTAARRLFGPS